MARKTSLKDMLDRETEKPVLEQLYVHYGVATDQLRRVPEVLNSIAAAFNRIASRDIGASELLRYMINRRKNDGGDWPKLGAKAEKFPPVGSLLTDADIEALRQIYQTMDLTSDELLFRPRMASELADKFEAATGKRIAGSLLVAVIVAKRKRGEWLKIRETAPAAFSDIPAVVQQQKAARA